MYIYIYTLNAHGAWLCFFMVFEESRDSKMQPPLVWVLSIGFLLGRLLVAEVSFTCHRWIAGRPGLTQVVTSTQRGPQHCMWVF